MEPCTGCSTADVWLSCASRGIARARIGSHFMTSPHQGPGHVGAVDAVVADRAVAESRAAEIVEGRRRAAQFRAGYGIGVAFQAEETLFGAAQHAGVRRSMWFVASGTTS